MRSALAVAAAVAALAACGGGDEDNAYPKKSVELFVNTCSKQEGSTREACRCMIDRLQATMTYTEFVAADNAARQGGEPSAGAAAKLEAAADRCR